MSEWPNTRLDSRKTEMAAVDLAINVLSQVLSRLSGTSADIKKRFGGDTVAERPSAKVREVETMLVISMLKSMKELQVVAKNEYLYENLQEEERERTSKTPRRDPRGRAR